MIHILIKRPAWARRTKAADFMIVLPRLKPDVAMFGAALAAYFWFGRNQEDEAVITAVITGGWVWADLFYDFVGLNKKS